MPRLWLVAAFVSQVTLLTPLTSQESDSMYRGRQCDKHLTELRMPGVADVGDSVRLDAVLTRDADAQKRITSARLRFGKDGLLRGVDVRGALSSWAASEIKDTIRAIAQSIGPYPHDFKVNLVRVNATGQIRVLAETVTCEPRQHVTPEAKSQLRRIQGEVPRGSVHRDALVQFILEADGRVSDAWMWDGTGFANVDSLTMQLFRAMRFDPAIVGRSAVATLLIQPFKF
jgi:hypothetical protein